MLKQDSMQISPTDRLLNQLSQNIGELLKRIILLAIELKTFDFNFFRGEINPLIFKIISADFNNLEDGINSIKELYKIDTNVLSNTDKLAISLYIKYYESVKHNNEDFILKELANTNDKQIIKIYTGKDKLSKLDRNKLLSGKITLKELITTGL